MLRRLLDSGKLTPGDAAAARKLYDDILAGQIGGLTQQQSRWAEQLCRKVGILAHQPKMTSREKTKETNAKLLAEFDALPRPKKPPGRR